jgi:DNA repair exonuclease SbcCD ATPase subunit
MSYGNELTTINFSNDMTLITGKNGEGKTTMFMALFYALYGKPYKKVKLASLINATTKKDSIVYVEFDIGSDNYTVKRGQKPAIFEITKNGELINQNSTTSVYQEYLEDILKMNDTIFKQLIFLGVNVNNKSFVDLTKSEKEELFQTITDTAIFGELKEGIKTKVKELTSSKLELDYKIKVIKELITAEEINIRKLTLHNESILLQNEEVITDLERRYEDNVIIIKKYDEAFSKLRDKKVVYDSKKAMLEVINNDANKVKDNLSNFMLQLRRIEDIEKTFSHCIGCATLNKISDVDISQKENIKEKIDNLSKTHNKMKIDITAKNEELEILLEVLYKGKQLKISKDAKEQEQLNILNEIERIKTTKAYDISTLLIDKKTEELNEHIITIDDVNTKLTKYDKLNKLFDNNNIKGIIIKQSLPLLNRFINEYLEFFSDFPFVFSVDNNFVSSIKTSNTIDYEFASLSNGQSMRISFSIILAFLKLVEHKNGITTNLLILDEILDSSLDYNGRNELLDIIKRNFINSSVFVISHNDDVVDSETFTKHIYVKKENNFSTIHLN